ncbi:hypothetical protein SISNIDRAFT_443730 [Sistotremastrum niveocremeum HHB9708]|uniref:Decapping nuclease n=1 Tax=Sistotremastrum niveocremeum HHB9708 TaxID=1314777 RepID=A0A164RP62_9AGAM|nr:hypothetical protein SISNIDRAFT_443730 [Sistotremastrum niveocremeum HHB9708]
MLSQRHKLRPERSSAFVTEDVEDVVQVFTVPKAPSLTARIRDLEPVASYSWINSEAPTILVPGVPPLWLDVSPFKVARDTGIETVDENGLRVGSGKSSLLPLFAAINDLHGPESGTDNTQPYDFSSLDIVADRNAVRKLLRWVLGGHDDLRIDIEVAGKTCLFTRREPADYEAIESFQGFGHNYEKAATKLVNGCEKATGHYRIIEFDLNGLKILLRFKLDAHITEPPPTLKQDTDDSDEESDDELLAVLAQLKITRNDRPRVPFNSGIKIIRSPSRALVSQSSTLEIKTRSAKREIDWFETHTQLYISQTAHFYLARYIRAGDFSAIPVDKRDLDWRQMEMGSSGRALVQAMGKLKQSLDEILKAARDANAKVESQDLNKRGMCLICTQGQLKLCWRKAGTGKAIGEEIRNLFV